MSRHRHWTGLFAIVCIAGAPVRAGDPSSEALEALPASEFRLEHARHLLFRAGFGASPEEVQRMHRLGLDALVDRLVDYGQVPDVVPPITVEPPKRADFQRLRGLDEEGRRKLRGELRREDARRFQEVRNWWVERMLRTRRPLEERMTLFWHGHFTSSQRDVRNAYHMYVQNQTLRRHATGSFRDLLHAISKDPAMLEYLDNNRNRKGRPNENYAREVMELFTLGIGNYTEKDIKEAARSFTGWTFDRFGDDFRFNRRQHDFGAKTVLGVSGRLDGTDTLDILLGQEHCAPFIAGKIFEYFAYSDPNPDLVRELGEQLRTSGYQIAPLLKRIFKSREFYSERCVGAQVKSPIVLLVSTVRMLGMNPPPAGLILQGAGRLGQQLMAPPNVKGWEGGTAWITTATLLDRYNLCGAMLQAGQPAERRRARSRPARGQNSEMMEMMSAGQRRGAGFRFARMMRNWDAAFSAGGIAMQLEAKDAATLVDGLAERYLCVQLPDERRQALVSFVLGQDESPALDFEALDSPASERKLRQLLHLLLSTPEYQVF